MYILHIYYKTRALSLFTRQHLIITNAVNCPKTNPGRKIEHFWVVFLNRATYFSFLLSVCETERIQTESDRSPNTVNIYPPDHQKQAPLGGNTKSVTHREPSSTQVTQITTEAQLVMHHTAGFCKHLRKKQLATILWEQALTSDSQIYTTQAHTMIHVRIGRDSRVISQCCKHHTH